MSGKKKYTIKVLKALCKSKGIKGYSKMKKSNKEHYIKLCAGSPKPKTPPNVLSIEQLEEERNIIARLMLKNISRKQLKIYNTKFTVILNELKRRKSPKKSVKKSVKKSPKKLKTPNIIKKNPKKELQYYQDSIILETPKTPKLSEVQKKIKNHKKELKELNKKEDRAKRNSLKKKIRVQKVLEKLLLKVVKIDGEKQKKGKVKD
jgi:hypothetical protein